MPLIMKYLRYFIKDRRVELNCKNFIIRQNNLLFSNNINSADVGGATYSIVKNAKMNNLKVYDYIEHILTKITGIKLTK